MILVKLTSMIALQIHVKTVSVVLMVPTTISAIVRLQPHGLVKIVTLMIFAHKLLHVTEMERAQVLLVLVIVVLMLMVVFNGPEQDALIKTIAPPILVRVTPSVAMELQARNVIVISVMDLLGRVLVLVELMHVMGIAKMVVVVQ